MVSLKNMDSERSKPSSWQSFGKVLARSRSHILHPYLSILSPLVKGYYFDMRLMTEFLPSSRSYICDAHPLFLRDGRM